MSAVNAVALLASAGADGYQISRSVRLRSSASAYFNRTPASTTNQTTFTWSAWVKRGALGSGVTGTLFYAGGSSSYWFQIRFNADSLSVVATNSGAATIIDVSTPAVFRDPSAWYHVVLKVDTTQATAANRVIVYVNGVQQTLTVSTQISQNQVTSVNTNVIHTIGQLNYATTNYFDGYLTEVNFIDGQALTPSSFGETDAITGVWKPKKYAGTYGTNGFYLNFSDNSAATAAAIGKDSSGNGNNWTPNNISVTSGVTYDSMLDTPTPYADGGNGRGNYCVWNPVQKSPNTAVSDGNLKAVNATGGYQSIVGSFGVTSGKWYWENTDVTCALGIAISTVNLSSTNEYVPNSGNAWVYVANGNKQNGGTNTAYGATYTSSDIIGVALDLDAGTVTFYKNGVSQGVAFSGLSANTYMPFAVLLNIQPNAIANFGQRPFAYTPPTGFKALNTQNLPDSTIVKGSTAFNISLDTGANIKTSTEALFGTNYLEWIKDRANANNHQLIDTVRGTSAVLQSNTTSAETTYSAPSGSSVGWAWKKGATQGFDIVTYTGTGSATTVAHSLGVAPAMMIVKARVQTAARNWAVWHKSLAGTEALYLNGTSGKATELGYWNSTAPSSSVFSLGGNNDTNGGSSQTYVAYLFAEVAGFSKFGSYTGNGSADGPFVYCGFRPRFVLVKRTDTTDNWIVVDTSRNTYNVVNEWLFPNTSDSTYTYSNPDILSNGFKQRNSGTGMNASGGTYIYAAFAENPFKNSLAR